MKRSGKQVYHVPSEMAGKTVAAILKQWQSGLSWNAARRLLLGRRIAINGTVTVDEGRRLKSGDVLHLLEHSKTPLPTRENIEILFADAHVVVAVKPALMTTLRHAEERHWNSKRKNLQPTMDESLPALLADLNKRQDANRSRGGSRRGKPSSPPPRSGLPKVRAVHRLDRDTSGVMVFARTPAAETHLIRQFKRHSIERKYRAIVFGQPEEATIVSHLVRDRGDGLRGSTDHEGEGERAVTHVRLVERLGKYSLIECRLETGRTHQIRIHLSEAGHFLCGDTMYHRRRDGSSFRDRSGAPRLALHAFELAFDHPATQERMTFQTPLPGDLHRFLKRLRSESESTSRSENPESASRAEPQEPAEQAPETGEET